MEKKSSKDLLRVLIITNLYPMKDRPQGGVFVLNRLSHYKNFSVDYLAIVPFYENSKVLMLLKNILHSPDFSPKNDIQSLLPLGIKRGIINFFQVRYLKKYRKTIAEAGKKILNLVDVENFDLIHAHGAFLDLPASEIARYVSEKTGKPYIVTLHGDDVNTVMNFRAEAYVETFEKASAVIFVSRKLLDNAKSFGYSGKNSYIIPNGINPDVFKPNDKEKVRKELGIFEPNTNYIGFVGALDYVKRADMFPKIFSEISKHIKNVKFILVGDGMYRRYIEENSRNLDLLITGFLDQKDVAKYMNALDIMILPSRNEGFGNVCIEAQACGTCVVGSSNGGIPEAIGFEECIVAEGENFEERFAQKVVEILKNGYDRDKLVNRARNYTWETIVEKEIEIYKRIV